MSLCEDEIIHKLSCQRFHMHYSGLSFPGFISTLLNIYSFCSSLRTAVIKWRRYGNLTLLFMDLSCCSEKKKKQNHKLTAMEKLFLGREPLNQQINVAWKYIIEISPVALKFKRYTKSFLAVTDPPQSKPKPNLL